MIDLDESIRALQFRVQTLQQIFGFEGISYQNLTKQRQKFQRNLNQLEKFQGSLSKLGIDQLLERCMLQDLQLQKHALDQKLQDILKSGDQSLDSKANYYQKLIENSMESLREIIDGVSKLEQVERSLEFKAVLCKYQHLLILIKLLIHLEIDEKIERIDNIQVKIKTIKQKATQQVKTLEQLSRIYGTCVRLIDFAYLIFQMNLINKKFALADHIISKLEQQQKQQESLKSKADEKIK